MVAHTLGHLLCPGLLLREEMEVGIDDLHRRVPFPYCKQLLGVIIAKSPEQKKDFFHIPCGTSAVHRSKAKKSRPFRAGIKDLAVITPAEQWPSRRRHLVVAGFLSFVPAQTRGLSHSAAPPLPRKTLRAFPGAPFSHHGLLILRPRANARPQLLRRSSSPQKSPSGFPGDPIFPPRLRQNKNPGPFGPG